MQKVFAFINKQALLFLALYFLALFFCFRNDYFFGDAISSTSRLASHIYETGDLFYPSGFDPGHPTTYSIFLAWSWKLFGKSLFISHSYGIFWCIFLLIGFRKAGSLFLNENQINLATLLGLVHPTFITQNAMMINTAMLMGAFLWAVYFLFSNKRIAYVIMLCVMVLSHLQGAFFLAALAIADFILNYKEVKLITFIQRNFLIYFIPFLGFVAWLYLHYQHTGWLVVSPDYTDTHDTNSVVQILKGLAYCFWRFLDYGMIVPFVIYVWLKYRYRVFSKADIFFWIVFSVTSAIMSMILKNTIAHRYFLALELFFLILVIQEIQQHAKKKNMILVLSFLALLAGSFIYYPGKTIADANMQYRSYFGLLDKLHADIPDSITIYSKAPIANDFIFSDPGIVKLRPSSNIQRINESRFDSLQCIVSSNVCAEFTPEESEILNGWYGKSYEKGAVFINLYLNPAYFAKPIGWELRRPGTFEQWMINLKKKLK